MNIKFNELSDPKEVKRISCTESIRVLNLEGNCFEHFHELSFFQLISVFPHLEELNGKNYRTLGQKNKKCNFNKIRAKTHKLYKAFNKIEK